MVNGECEGGSSSVERDQPLMNIEVSARGVALLILRCNNITSHVPSYICVVGQRPHKQRLRSNLCPGFVTVIERCKYVYDLCSDDSYCT